MAIPYRKAPRAADVGVAAYLDVVVRAGGAERLLLGALLLMDGRGQPLEFVHNTLSAPTGFLWPDERVDVLGIAALGHSLFDACRREPDLLLCLPTLGPPTILHTELAPSIPFALIPDGAEDLEAWTWINAPPSAGMRAHALCEELCRRGLVREPFARLRKGLREVYGGEFGDGKVRPGSGGGSARVSGDPAR
ncbi:MAG: hypothetical protein HZB55_14975 [Deltaproteobacteria bacterium]|nr:hypothetical protein [Deltaproteobacteria bacterium]